MNLTNITFNYFTDNTKSIQWESAISQYCKDWRNYSTYAHKTYIIYLGLIFLFSILALIYNPHIHYFKIIKTDNKIIKKLGLNIMKVDLKLFTFLKNIVIDILLIKIFQVYFIIKLFLGGF